MQKFEYNIVYSARRSIGISVSPDKGVIVRAPYRTSMRTIQRLVESKSGWILKHIEKYSDLKRLNGSNDLTDGSIILYRGKEYTLRIYQSSGGKVEVNGNEIMLSVEAAWSIDKIKDLLRKWYEARAAEYFGARMYELLEKFARFGFSPTGLSIRTMRRRWGSCTSKGKITLNSELIKLEDIFADYVLLHELCHLHHPNHGKEFYRLLGEVFPEWKSVRKRLGNYLS